MLLQCRPTKPTLVLTIFRYTTLFRSDNTIDNTIDTSAVQKFFNNLPEKALTLGVRILLALVVFFIGVQIIKFIRKLIKKSMIKAKADKGAIQFIDSFIKAALYILLVFMIASSFGLDAASIVAILGSAGVAIGLAIQGSLSNLAGGVLILMLKPFKVGDYIIENATNKEGTVEEIEIFYTKLVTPDNKIIILPNGSLANNSLVNVTAALVRRCEIFVGISYSSNIQVAREAILKVLDQDNAVLQEKEKIVFVNNLADSSIELGVRCWFTNDDFWYGKWRITENIKNALDDANIVIPFPQMDVHLPKELI